MPKLHNQLTYLFIWSRDFFHECICITILHRTTYKHTEQEINSLSLALFKTFYSSPLRYLALHKVLNRINEVNTEESKQNVFLIAVPSVEREIGDFLHKANTPPAAPRRHH